MLFIFHAIIYLVCLLLFFERLVVSHTNKIGNDMVYITGLGKKGFTEYLEAIKKNTEVIASVFKDYRIIILIHPNDIPKLDEWKRKDKKLIILSEDISKSKSLCPAHDEKFPSCRTLNLAHLRNLLLKEVYNQVEIIKVPMESSVMISFDLDEVNNGPDFYPFNRTVLTTVLSESNLWDVLSFNREIFYDFWALRYKRYNINCWATIIPFLKPGEMIAALNNDISKSLKESVSNYFPVYSSWNGLAIYKLSTTIGCEYSGVFNGSAHAVFNNTIMRYSYSKFGEVELWPFHKCLKERHRAKIMIYKYFITSRNMTFIEANKN